MVRLESFDIDTVVYTRVSLIWLLPSLACMKVEILDVVVNSRVETGFCGCADAEEVGVYGCEVAIGVEHNDAPDAERDDVDVCFCMLLLAMSHLRV